MARTSTSTFPTTFSVWRKRRKTASMCFSCKITKKVPKNLVPNFSLDPHPNPKLFPRSTSHSQTFPMFHIPFPNFSYVPQHGPKHFPRSTSQSQPFPSIGLALSPNPDPSLLCRYDLPEWKHLPGTNFLLHTLRETDGAGGKLVLDPRSVLQMEVHAVQAHFNKGRTETVSGSHCPTHGPFIHTSSDP